MKLKNFSFLIILLFIFKHWVWVSSSHDVSSHEITTHHLSNSISQNRFQTLWDSPSNDDPDCGNDPPCQMGAECKPTPLGSDKCDCNTAWPGWGDRSCSVQNCRVNLDFESSDRLSKHTQQLPLNETSNSCSCPDGWGGIYCRMCLTDDGCNSRYSDFLKDKNGTMRCDKSMVMWNKYNSRDFNCLIEDEIIIALVGGKVKMNGQCMGISILNNGTDPDGECIVVGFSDIGYPPPKEQINSLHALEKLSKLNPSPEEELPEFSTIGIDIPPGYLTSIFYCYFRKCQAILSDDHSHIKYQCNQAKCRATDIYPVSDVFKLMLMAAKTLSTWECNTLTDECILSQVELGWNNLRMSCHAGECLYGDHPYPPVKPKNWMTEIIVASSLGVLFIGSLLVNLMYILYSRFQDNRKMRIWERENLNGANSFSFEDISYSLRLYDPVKSKIGPTNKKILKKISGTVQRGQILAIMGASGAGKTTLLDILSARRKTGKVSGDLLIDGKYVNHDFKRQIGYVTQEIQLMGTMTVRECLYFSANLRLPQNVSNEEKKRRVEEAMQDLGISHIADRYIGTALRRGISGGEKRRVNIACELVISPTVLFLDEPTTGLDSYNALVVVQCLKALADKGKIIVMSIHQPRYNIFNMFDNLLLLSEGHTVYFGEAKKALNYFENLGYKCDPQTNPSDFILDVVITAAKKQKQNLKLPAPMQREDSNELNKLVNHYRSVSGSLDNDSLTSIADMISNEKSNDTGDILPNGKTNIQDGISRGFIRTNSNTGVNEATQLINRPKKRKNIFGMEKSSALIAMHGDTQSTSFYSQFYHLSIRTTKNFFRNYMLLPLHIGTAIIMSTFIGLLFWKLEMTIPVGLQNRMGAMFFTCALLGLTCTTSLEMFVSERAIFISERANRYYGPWAYYFSKILFDVIPLRVIPPILFGSISYFMIGLRYDGNIYYFLDYILILVLFNVACGGVTLTIGIISPNVALGNMITLLLLFYFMLFGGFLLNNDNIPWYLAPLRFTSPFQYALEAMLSNELTGQVIDVEVKHVGGVTKLPGDIVLTNFGFDVAHYGFDMGMLAGWSIIFLVIPGILLYYFVKERR